MHTVFIQCLIFGAYYFAKVETVEPCVPKHHLYKPLLTKHLLSDCSIIVFWYQVYLKDRVTNYHWSQGVWIREISLCYCSSLKLHLDIRLFSTVV